MSKTLEKTFDKKVRERADEVKSVAQRVVSVEQQIARLQEVRGNLITNRLQLEGRLIEAFDTFALVAGRTHPLKKEFMPEPQNQPKLKKSSEEGENPGATPPKDSPESVTKKGKKGTK